MLLGNLAQHPLMLHSLTQNLYSTFFPKTSALPTRRLPCSKNIHYSHVILMRMLHPCSVIWLVLYCDALFLYTEWSFFWMTNSAWGGGMLLSSFPFQAPSFGGQLLWRPGGYLTEASQAGRQSNSEYGIKFLKWQDLLPDTTDNIILSWYNFPFSF